MTSPTPAPADTLLAKLSRRVLDHVPSDGLLAARQRIDAVLDERARQYSLFEPTGPRLVQTQPPATGHQPPATDASLASVLSPSQLSTWGSCAAKWYFKHVLHLADPPTGSLTQGKAVHAALAANFRQKIETKQDLPAMGVVAVYRQAWSEEAKDTEFRDDEDPAELSKQGEALVTLYLDRCAPAIQPARVEYRCEGEISGVRVQGIVDLLDSEGRVIDLKTRAARLHAVEADSRRQVATYRAICPGATGLGRIDVLTKTKTPAVQQLDFSIDGSNLLEIETLYPLAQEGMRSGLYFPNRSSHRCGRKYCGYWRRCETEFGGRVDE